MPYVENPPEPAKTSEECYKRAANLMALVEKKAHNGASTTTKLLLDAAKEYRAIGDKLVITETERAARTVSLRAVAGDMDELIELLGGTDHDELAGRIAEQLASIIRES